MAVQRVIERKNPKQEIFTSDLPRSNVFTLGKSRFLSDIQIMVEIRYTTGVAAPTLKEDDILNYVRQIRIEGSGGVTLKSMSGEVAWKREKYFQGTADLREIPTTASSTLTARLGLRVRFAVDDAIEPDRTLLNATKFDTLALTIDTGVLSDIFATNIPTLVSTTITVTEFERQFPLSPIDFTNIEITEQISVTQNSIEKNFEFDRRTPVRAIYIRAENPSGLNSDDIIDEIQIRLNDKDVIRRIRWQDLRADNKKFFSLEALEVGFLIWHFDKDGDLEDVLDLRDVKKFEILVTTTGFGAGNATIFLTFQELGAPVK